MSRTAILATKENISNGKWDKASTWASYTKNRIPHKTLGGKSPIEILFNKKNSLEERKNLRSFRKQVSCFDYIVIDKLSGQSYEAQVVGYTATYGVY